MWARDEHGETPVRPGEYYELLEISEGRIKAALDRCKQEVEAACLRLEAFLQGECYNHGVKTDIGDMANFIREEKALLEDKASDVVNALLKRVDYLERS